MCDHGLELPDKIAKSGGQINNKVPTLGYIHTGRKRITRLGHTGGVCSP